MDFPTRSNVHRRHRSDFRFQSPRFPDLRNFSRLTDNLFHSRHEPQRSPGSHPHWHYVPPPYCYGPPPPPPPPPHSQDYSHPTRYSTSAKQNLGYPLVTPEPPASAKSTASAPSAPLPEGQWSKSIPAPSAPPADELR